MARHRKKLKLSNVNIQSRKLYTYKQHTLTCCYPIEPPFSFSANYKTVTIDKTMMNYGAEAFIKTQYFDYPSFNATKKQYTRGVKKRDKPALLKINQ
jgi:hypothetical protein